MIHFNHLAELLAMAMVGLFTTTSGSRRSGSAPATRDTRGVAARRHAHGQDAATDVPRARRDRRGGRADREGQRFITRIMSESAGRSRPRGRAGRQHYAALRPPPRTARLADFVAPDAASIPCVVATGLHAASLAKLPASLLLRPKAPPPERSQPCDLTRAFKGARDSAQPRTPSTALPSGAICVALTSPVLGADAPKPRRTIKGSDPNRITDAGTSLPIASRYRSTLFGSPPK
jgi:hypothetical protein